MQPFQSADSVIELTAAVHRHQVDHELVKGNSVWLHSVSFICLIHPFDHSNGSHQRTDVVSLPLRIIDILSCPRILPVGQCLNHHLFITDFTFQQLMTPFGDNQLLVILKIDLHQSQFKQRLHISVHRISAVWINIVYQFLNLFLCRITAFQKGSLFFGKMVKLRSCHTSLNKVPKISAPCFLIPFCSIHRTKALQHIYHTIHILHTAHQNPTFLKKQSIHALFLLNNIFI